MPVVINGSTGISGADGSAGTPAVQGTDTNTGIYFPGADRIGFAEGGVQVGEFDASSNFLFNSGYGSVAIAYGCRAWVNFNGTGTVAIRASGNVTSITDNGTGDYTVNFTNAMPDANYGFTTCAGNTATSSASTGPVNAAPTTSALRFQTVTLSPLVLADCTFVAVAVFR
jgi:hypothetical protein